MSNVTVLTNIFTTSRLPVILTTYRRIADDNNHNYYRFVRIAAADLNSYDVNRTRDQPRIARNFSRLLTNIDENPDN
jgi:hypothetical protein